MSRQWDTHREFKPSYKWVAKLVFLGWLQALAEPNWRWHFRELCAGLRGILSGVMVFLLGVMLLAFSPIVFPLFCFAHKRTRRRQRLRYLKVMRMRDSDI